MLLEVQVVKFPLFVIVNNLCTKGRYTTVLFDILIEAKDQQWNVFKRWWLCKRMYTVSLYNSGDKDLQNNKTAIHAFSLNIFEQAMAEKLNK